MRSNRCKSNYINNTIKCQWIKKNSKFARLDKKQDQIYPVYRGHFSLKDTEIHVIYDQRKAVVTILIQTLASPSHYQVLATR
jgi:hypothetical protein